MLRPLRWWDIADIVALERDLFGATAWPAETFWSELAQPSRTYLVATGDDGVAGYAGVLAAGGPEADVQTLAVAPSAQGRGVGALLLSALVDRAREAGATSLLLEVRADNEPAIALYQRFGFSRISVRRRYYQPGDVDALVLRRRPL